MHLPDAVTRALKIWHLFGCSALYSLVSGFHRNPQEKIGLLEAAGPQTPPPFPPESDAGHACVSTERVRVWPSLPLMCLLGEGDVTTAECYTLPAPLTAVYLLLWFSLLSSLTTFLNEREKSRESSFSNIICFFSCLFFVCFQLDLWVQLPPHSRLCEWRCCEAGPKAVPDYTPWTSSWANGSLESWWDRGSFPSTHPHQPCTAGPG